MSKLFSRNLFSPKYLDSKVLLPNYKTLGQTQDKSLSLKVDACKDSFTNPVTFIDKPLSGIHGCLALNCSPSGVCEKFCFINSSR